MKIALFILVSTVLLSGCGKTVTVVEEVNSESNGIGGIELPIQRNFTSSELTIAKRICSALKHKREFFETLEDKKEVFQFRGVNKYCASPTSITISLFNAIISNADSPDFEYIADKNQIKYFKDVITDQNSAMRLLCSNVANSDTVSNTFLDGDSLLAVDFSINQGYDHFNALRKLKDQSNNYKLIHAESISIITHKSQAEEKFHGVEIARVKHTACPNSTEFSSVGQNRVSALTPFE